MASRPYGAGPYGTARYGVGSGTNYVIAAQASIAFSIRLSPTGIYGVGAATGIRTAIWGSAARIWSPQAATQIVFSLKLARPLRIALAAASTQVSFNVQGVVVKTWMDGPGFVPCAPGTWNQILPPWTIREAA